MKPTIEEIQKAIKDLPAGFNVHILDDAWYSTKAQARALGVESGAPSVPVVRINLPQMGCLELHPSDDAVSIKCYCCFGGNPDHGTYKLNELKSVIEALWNHRCPPWPG